VGTPKKVLTIAGSDSGGGAGIQADLKTIAALGCYGLSAITALTAQNTQGVRAIHAPEPEFLHEQLVAVFEDIGADAIKIGMLHSPQIVDVVAQTLLKFKPAHVVLDPVMVATSGDTLITPQTQEAIVEKLFPLADVITPNLDELSLLVGEPITRPHQFEAAAKKIFELGAHAVLIKGGHLDQPNLVDVLYEMDRHGPSGLAMTSEKEGRAMTDSKTSLRGASAPRQSTVTEIVRLRIDTKNLHGTGCTLSSAIACFLAQGYPLKAAVKGSQDYVYQAIAAAVDMQIGQGHGPVNHSFNPQPLQLYDTQT
jgi:hydroxymethylpyrimidine/phosphomethylpyrimidine kinase